nr:IPT/TIG domain-containing protein [Rhodoferax sp.]
YWQVNVRNQTTNALHTSSMLASGQMSYAVPSGTLQAGVQYKWDVTACPDTACNNLATYKTSANFYFTPAAVVAAPPTISSVSPNPVTGSASAQTVTINGTGFANKPTLTLTWTGQSGYTVPAAQVTYVSSTQVQMSITTTTAADSWTVKATNPDSRVSNVVGFTVVAPAAASPTISSVSPNPAVATGAAQPFTINGNNFASGATVTLRTSGGGVYANRTISSLSATQIVINPNFGTVADTWTVEVISTGGVSSGRFTFTVRL